MTALSRAFFSAFLELAADESGAALVEYALVLATLTISTIVAFELVTSTADSNISGNQQNLTNSATAQGAGVGSP